MLAMPVLAFCGGDALTHEVGLVMLFITTTLLLVMVDPRSKIVPFFNLPFMLA